MEYEIPSSIKKLLTKEFLLNFKKNAIAEFNENDKKQNKEPMNYEEMTYLNWWCFVESTVGFGNAFKKTCNEMNVISLLHYQESLDWNDGDMFDNELCLLMVEYEIIPYGTEGLDKQALGVVREKYENDPNIKSVSIDEVTYSILNKLVEVCENTKHMEEMIEHYDNEEDFSRCNWVDIEGEGYGWIWLNEENNEDKWHDLLKNKMLQFIENKKIKVLKNKEMVVIAKTDKKTIFHFIERETEMKDTIYTFSNEEIVY